MEQPFKNTLTNLCRLRFERSRYDDEQIIQISDNTNQTLFSFLIYKNETYYMPALTQSWVFRVS